MLRTVFEYGAGWHGHCTAALPDNRGEVFVAMKGIAERTSAWLECANGIEASLVELVVAASECSEDLVEVSDLVDGLLATGKVVLRRSEPLATIPPR